MSVLRQTCFSSARTPGRCVLFFVVVGYVYLDPTNMAATLSGVSTFDEIDDGAKFDGGGSPVGQFRQRTRFAFL